MYTERCSHVLLRGNVISQINPVFSSLELNMDLPSAQMSAVGQSSAAASGEQVSTALNTFPC